MTDLSERLYDARCRADKLKLDYGIARKTAKRERAKLTEAKANLAAAIEARDIAQAVGETVQRQAHGHVSDLVSRCLSAVFGKDAYSFSIIFDKKRNRTEARAVFLRNGDEIDPLSAAGGGVVDVTAFALRLAVLLLRHPQPRRFVVLDEPCKMLSRDYVPRMRVLIETLAEELSFQFVIITHNDELASGAIVRIGS